MSFRYSERSAERGTSVFRAPIDSVLGNRYKIIADAGEGNFARVVEAVDKTSRQRVAVKIIKQEYSRDAACESEILNTIKRYDQEERQKVVHVLRSMTISGNPCFVFKMLGPSLRSRKMGPGRVTRYQLAHFIKDIGSALRFLHFECKIVHTDIKPENILLDCHTAGDKGIGSGWTLCDFGSASKYSSVGDRDLISTRPYRSPEAVLGCPWSYAVDIWSLACVLIEIIKGSPLFDSRNDEEQLYLIEKHIGIIPPSVTDKAAPRCKEYLYSSRDKFVRSKSCSRSWIEGVDDPQFRSLLREALCLAPHKRLRADQMLHHPFVAQYFPSLDPIIASTPPSIYESESGKAYTLPSVQSKIRLPPPSLQTPAPCAAAASIESSRSDIKIPTRQVVFSYRELANGRKVVHV
eukprot:TRINITY_DN22595_c0_g1_i1.p1 TRINITY_DN22595_c0_g1~~TRINITY_DN22595_c0_g1_i1.p1  ORF type:complete len:407 (+),score=43.98 TRINITY_DN22595_c0_g1_i1:104-1324(+)